MARIGFRHALRAEFTKTLTLRSIRATLVAALVVPAVLAFASGLTFDPVSGSRFSLESHGFETAGFGQPLVILLAALISGNEYLDGQLRTTLIATPKRGRVLAAKLVIVTVAGAAIGWVAIGSAVLIEHAALGEYGLPLAQFTVGMGWNLLGVGINYALIALIAAAVTVIARTVIVTLVVLVPLVLGITISLVGTVPILKYLPDLAGIQLLMPYPGVGVLDPLLGGGVMMLWAVVLIGIAWALFRTRDTPAG
ncbi:ABC transporter permease [Microbacterium sp. NPDC090225]|uniref:ABC transporter permease n=1 Tax=Microbacterium sp. NPDC090225 TaxID=3364207 RepID=UPI003826EA59